MNNEINRDYRAMYKFADYLENFSEELLYTVNDLQEACNSAETMIQDKSGRNALYVISNLIESIKSGIDALNELDQNIKISAAFLEQAENLDV